MKVTRKVSKIFIHCSDSDLPEHDNIEMIAEWHKQRGFSEIGYHFVITKDGTVHNGRCLEKIPAAQVGYNTGSIAICLTGRSNFSHEQFASLKQFCSEINTSIKGVTFHGHCEVSSKLCPVFDYKLVLNLQNGKLPIILNEVSKPVQFYSKIEQTVHNSVIQSRCGNVGGFQRLLRQVVGILDSIL